MNKKERQKLLTRMMNSDSPDDIGVAINMYPSHRKFFNDLYEVHERGEVDMDNFIISYNVLYKEYINYINEEKLSLYNILSNIFLGSSILLFIYVIISGALHVVDNFGYNVY